LNSKIQRALSESKSTLVRIGLLSFFINLFMLAPALYMLQLYDRVVTGRSEETLLMLTIILVFIFIFLFLLDWLRHKIMIRIGNKFDLFLKENIFKSLFKWSLSEPANANVTPLRDLFQIRNFITSPGLLAFFDAPWSLMYLFILFLFHPYFGYCGVVAIITISIFVFLNEKSTKEPYEESNNVHMQNLDNASGYLKNSEVVHAMGMGNVLYKTYDQQNKIWIETQTQVGDLSSTWSSYIKYLRLLFQSAILGMGAYLVINMELTPGMMIAGSLLLGRVLAPLDVMVGHWKNLTLTRQSVKRLGKLLDEFPKQKELMELPEPKGNIGVENITLIPPKGMEPILKGIDCKFEQGSVTSIIGPSGSGKSSLLRAILGVWPIASGKVTIDKVDIRQWDHNELGQYIGYLPQDIELFSGTVAQNIARMEEEVDSTKVIEAAKLAGVHEIILLLPDGYNTQIGMQGTILSGGQQQRIALARAIYGNVKLVVLDEPNSNLDDLGELALVKAIQRLKSANITVIMVTHKMNIIKYTDNVIILKDGFVQSNSTTEEFFKAISNKAISG
jgi:ATP-binding cassette, subfamily C, bacterial EexD